MTTKNILSQDIANHIEENRVFGDYLRDSVKHTFADAGLYGAQRSVLDWCAARLFSKQEEYFEVLKQYKAAIENASKQI